MVAICEAAVTNAYILGRTTGLEGLMELHLGDIVQTTDCHKRPVTGEIIQLLEHTIIVAQGDYRAVVPKKNLTKAGDTFPPFKQKRPPSMVRPRENTSRH